VSAVLVLAAVTASCGDDKPPERTPKAPSFPDVTFGANLAQIRGHHLVGLALYRAGKKTEALTHAGHPIGEILPSVDERIRAKDRRVADVLKTAIGAVSSSIEAAEPAEDVAKAVDAATAAVVAAEAQALTELRHSPLYLGSVVAALLATAAKEYGEAVLGGTVRALVEYQDAYGFVRVAGLIYAQVESEVRRIGPVEADQIAASFRRIESFLPTPDAPPKPVRHEEVRKEALFIAGKIQETVGAILQPARAANEIVGRIRQLLDEALAEYAKGASDRAADLLSEAYLQHYEVIELDVIQFAGPVNTELEPLLATGIGDRVQAGASMEEVRRAIERAKVLLAQALAALDRGASPGG
jgi:hypothetical protein